MVVDHDENFLQVPISILYYSWADQLLSDRRGADFPGGGCIGALPKRLLRFGSFKNTLYR